MPKLWVLKNETQEMLKKSNSEKYRGKQECTELEMKYLEKCEFRMCYYS